MNKRVTKARHFGFLLYPDSVPDDWIVQLEKLDVSIAVSPLHNMDEKKNPYDWSGSDIVKDGKHFKKAHYHGIYIAKNPVTVESVRKKLKRRLGDNAVNHLEIIDSIKGAYEYLTHESKDAIAKKKHVYDKRKIIYINDFDIDRYVTLDESQKKQLRNDLLDIVDTFEIVNLKELRAFLRWRGNEFGITNDNDVVDTVSASGNLFKMAFDGNYQNGFRPKYSKRIDLDSGEIINGISDK